MVETMFYPKGENTFKGTLGIKAIRELVKDLGDEEKEPQAKVFHCLLLIIPITNCALNPLL